MPSPTGYSASHSVSLSNSTLLNSLLAGSAWGNAWATGTTSLSYSFVVVGKSMFYNRYSDSSEYLNAYNLSAAQQTAVKGALGAWSAVANISFTQVTETSTSVGDLRFGGFSGMGNTAAAWAYYPANSPSGGDVWIGPATNQAKPVAGTYDYMTFMHEIGHALGLKHPFESASNNSAVLPDALDDVRYTLMSYSNDYYNAQMTAYVEPTTPMLYDIAAIQYLYGANMTWQTGNNTYSFKPGQVVFQTIWDAGGTDTLDASNQTAGVLLNLNEGEFSNIGALFYDYARNEMINNGLAIAYGAKIENATGSAFADTLIGNALDNVLDGRGGADIMRGGLGNDTYIVDNVSDVVIEESTLASEIDTVRASVSYTLSANVENLVLTGNANLNGVGNELDNVITGNAGSNTLVGGAGNDSLYGGAGNDRLEGGEGNDLLDGGAGIDTLIGGQGDDIYYVDNLRDVVIELEGAAEGRDLVRASVSYVLAANVEDGELLGKANLSLTGNALDNVLTGNDGANVLRGGGGADTLIGGLGNDTYYVDSIDDVIIESGTSVKEIDNVFSSVNWTLSDNLENLTLTGTDNINGTGNTQNNRITGNAGDNWLDGGEGIDTLVGGQGNDTYVVDNLRDVVIEGANAGIDTVRASVNWTLGANLENLTLTGLDNLNGTGNTLNNVIIGNAGNNTLNGGAGNDVLDGGAGNDVLIGGLGTDTMTGGQGADIFVFSLLKEMGLGDKRDVITDFNGAEGDRIDLTKIDANVLLKGVNAFTFIGSGDFTGAGQLRFADEILSGNIDAKLGSDGKFTADFEIKLVGVTSFSQDHLAA